MGREAVLACVVANLSTYKPVTDEKMHRAETNGEDMQDEGRREERVSFYDVGGGQRVELQRVEMGTARFGMSQAADVDLA
ncbi:hypothetical protein KM043_018342 [Ampulex compressa]|nr:hypothetical protein KM043_018342 [Ampulex compressa]